MPFTDSEILETVRMFELETFDIRTTTLGISLLDCADPDLESAAEKVYTKIVHHGRNLVEVAGGIEADLGVPIINQRVSTTPIALVAAASASDDLVPFARAMDAAAAEIGIDYIGGYTAYVHKGFTRADEALLNSIPRPCRDGTRVLERLPRHDEGRDQHGRHGQVRPGRPRHREADRRRGRPRLREARVLLEPGGGQPLHRRRAHRHRGARDGAQRRGLRSWRRALRARATRPRGGPPVRGRDDQAHRFQDHPNGRPWAAGRAADGDGLRHRRRLPRADAGGGDSVADILEPHRRRAHRRARPRRPSRCSRTPSRRAAPWRRRRSAGSVRSSSCPRTRA